MSRIVRFLGRTKAYFTECKQNMAPMPNPDWYEEQKETRVTFKNLRKLPLSTHVEVWSSTWQWYWGSFEESFAWGRRRKEEAKKKEAQEKLDALQSIVKEAREATHNTPEDLEKSKQALKELLEEIHENRDELKSAAQEKLDLIRVSLSEFSAGYREARDEEIKRVMGMDKSVLQSFLSERAGEVKHATSIISDAILDKVDDKDGARSKTGQRNPAAAVRPGGAAGAGAGAAAAEEANPEDEAPGADGQGPSRFLSKRARRAVDDALRDPDLERLAGRARGFARERLLQAEAAARILKGEDEEQAGDGGGGGGGGKESRVRGENRAAGAARDAGGGEVGSSKETETPIISGLAREASEFVTGRVGQAREGAREVVEAAMDVRRSRRAAAAAAAAAAERSNEEREVGRSGGSGGGGVRGGGETGEGDKEGGAR